MDFLKHLTFINYFIFFSLFYVVFQLNYKSKIHLVLFLIISVSLINEFYNVYLITEKKDQFWNNNAFVLLNQILWYGLFSMVLNKKRLFLLLFSIFSTFSIFMYLKYNVLTEFIFEIFIFGAVIYVSFFLIFSFLRLKNEEITFFTSNHFIIISAPLLFFIGTSLIFSFRNDNLAKFVILNNISFYTFITYFVNIIYYSLINIYIYKERRPKNV